MKLIYRAQIYDDTPAAIQPYIKPHALNWRFHSLGQKFEPTPCLRVRTATGNELALSTCS
ncbi:hypothetical protein [Scytonema millei]|uniref:Uncharacterized protein n=1 Tax=Scytonema millei VB511283 TaxID=1245923 RepID=A0A9X5I4Q3_9CYAN|nr:hypothetical protein [Scytonema millei]NHC35848.1 hypothetical protein [Scytonema millei VB511283]